MRYSARWTSIATVHFIRYRNPMELGTSPARIFEDSSRQLWRKKSGLLPPSVRWRYKSNPTKISVIRREAERHWFGGKRERPASGRRRQSISNYKIRHRAVTPPYDAHLQRKSASQKCRIECGLIIAAQTPPVDFQTLAHRGSFVVAGSDS